MDALCAGSSMSMKQIGGDVGTPLCQCSVLGERLSTFLLASMVSNLSALPM